MNVITARRRNPERTEARRQQVLEAAVSCFRKEGFRGASMADISAAAGMSPGHIYHYFKNKEAIVEAIVDLDKQRVLEHIEDLKGQPNILEGLIAGLDQRLNECETDCAAFLLEMYAEATRNPIVGDLIRDRCVTLNQHLKDALTIGQRQGSVATDIDLENTTDLIAAVIFGLDLRLALWLEADRVGMATLQRQFLLQHAGAEVKRPPMWP